jgi:hypothetical protein
MRLGVMLGRLVARIHRLGGVTVGGVRVMGGLFVFAALVVLGRLVVMLGGVFVVLSGRLMMMGAVVGRFRHWGSSLLVGASRDDASPQIGRRGGTLAPLDDAPMTSPLLFGPGRSFPAVGGSPGAAITNLCMDLRDRIGLADGGGRCPGALVSGLASRCASGDGGAGAIIIARGADGFTGTCGDLQ